MTEARRRRLSTLALVVAVLTAGLIGTVDATQQMEGEELTTGHTVFADASTSFNGCFAGLAGALLQQVTWFNGHTLFSRMDGGGQKFVYVTEHFTADDGEWNEETGFRAQVDPSEKTLYRTDNTYKFSDKNDPDKEWTVYEYFELRDKRELDTGLHNPEDGDEEYVVTKEKVYVFVVEVGNDAIWDPTLKKDYNFAMVVDTCRFHGSGNSTDHDGVDGENGMPRGQHKNQTGMNESHEHGTFQVDIYVGGEPQALDEVQFPDGRNQTQADGGEES